MSDIVLRQDGQLPIPTQIRYKDMGDGTYALVFATLMSGVNCDGGGGLGGGEWGETEWILAPSTNYMVRVTNRSGAAIQLSVSLGWSEL